jgi:hypothetical protein
MIIINNNFDIGEIVYLKTDFDQLPRIITAVMYSADGGTLYKVNQGEIGNWQYEIELSRDKDMDLITSAL